MNMRKESPKIALTNNDAERVVLGKVLSTPATFWDYHGILQAEHFSRQIYRDIFSAIYGLNLEGKPVSLRTLQARVGPEYEDDGKSTMTLMTAMIRDVEDVTDASDQVNQIIDLWRRRRVIEVAKQFADEASKAATDTSYMLTDLENCVKDISMQSQAEPLKLIGELASSVVQKSGDAQKTGKVVGIDVGLAGLREIMGNIHPGDLGYVIASQGDGKTIMGMHLLRTAATAGVTGLMHQLEMKAEQMAGRALANDAQIGISDIEEGNYDFYAMDRLREALQALHALPIYIDDRPKLTVEKIRERCITLKRTKNLGMLVVDHMRLVQTQRRTKDRFERAEYVSSELKAMAKELDIAVVGLSQVTRSSQRREDPFPGITDSDMGSAVEQDADWVISLFRRERWLLSQRPDEHDPSYHEWAEKYAKAKNRIDIRCLKRRRGASMQTRTFGFDGAKYSIYEVER